MEKGPPARRFFFCNKPRNETIDRTGDTYSQSHHDCHFNHL